MGPSHLQLIRTRILCTSNRRTGRWRRKEQEMTRFATCLFAVMAMLFTALPTKAEAAGDYTAELQAFLTTLGPAERERFDNWWGRMPDYFKQSLFESKFENWREVIYCD
jgi:hypothetical protein